MRLIEYVVVLKRTFPAKVLFGAYFFLAGDHLKPQFMQLFIISFLPINPTRMLTGTEKSIEIPHRI